MGIATPSSAAFEISFSDAWKWIAKRALVYVGVCAAVIASFFIAAAIYSAVSDFTSKPIPNPAVQQPIRTVPKIEPKPKLLLPTPVPLVGLPAPEIVYKFVGAEVFDADNKKLGKLMDIRVGSENTHLLISTLNRVHGQTEAFPVTPISGVNHKAGEPPPTSAVGVSGIPDNAEIYWITLKIQPSELFHSSSLPETLRGFGLQLKTP